MGHAREHLQRVLAQRLANDGGAAAHHASLTEYEQMLAQLLDHRRQLHDIQSIERKVALKRTLLPAYAAWIYGVMQGDSGVQDEVFVTCMLWNMDIGDWNQSLLMAAYAIRHKLVMPDRFERTVATVLIDEMTDAALKPNQTVPLAALIEAHALTANEDMPDQVLAKLCKAIGYQLRDSSDKEKALEFLQRALTLNDKVGVKKDIERLEREIRNEQNKAASEEPAA